MKIIYYSAILLFAGLLCASCVETIYPESVEEAPIVVNSVLDTSDTQSLYLAFSSKVSEVEDFIIIDNADAVLREITAGDTLTVATFSFENDGMWRTRFRPLSGKKYQLLIDIPGEKRISATTRMPDTMMVQSFIEMPAGSVGPISRKYYPGTSYSSKFKENTLYLYMSGEDDKGNTLIANEIATDHLFEDLFNITGAVYFMPEPDFEPTIFLRHPIWYPTVNGRAFHKIYIRIPNPDKYVNSYSEIESSITKGHFTVATLDTLDKKINKLTILQVSDELDAYFKSVLTEQSKQEVTDNFLLVYDRTNISGNLINALGVFGAYNKYELEWFLSTSDLWKRWR